MNGEEASSWRLDLGEVRSVAAIIGAAFALYRRYPLLFLALAASVVVPYELIVLAITGYGPVRQGRVPGVGGLVVLPALEEGFVGALVSALHIHAVVLAGEGQQPTLREVARRTVPVLPAVIATSIVYGIATSVGFLLLFVPGVVLGLRWAVAAQAAAVENQGWQEALKRSRELARERWLHITGLFIATGLIVFAVYEPAYQLSSGHGSAAGSVALGIAIATVRQSFVALTLALLYFDLVARPQVARAPTAPHEWPRDLEP